MTIRAFHEPAGHPGIVFGREVDAAKGVGLMRIKTRGDQDDVGPEEIDSREDFLGERVRVGLVISARIHRTVQRSALPGASASF